eukprot:CAMPEP_0198297850 /NCGR_PEP_ID=MMETSP1449-20131203/38570_1 /TAXON_ID=420275 /ORGANISM="Attheya septentrionalis, Strain CCMP2084" /LENGTH=317 /DNA_ID=CAMNT_0043998937 /DNA_START=109 /DNA_END=1059 /DNA_ORIENTATION=-
MCECGRRIRQTRRRRPDDPKFLRIRPAAIRLPVVCICICIVGLFLLLIICDAQGRTIINNGSPWVATFQFQPNPSVIRRSSFQKTVPLWESSSSSSSSSSSNKGGSNVGLYVEAAKQKLPWEILQEKEQRPVLNLSARQVSPEQLSVEEEEEDSTLLSSQGWEDGTVWCNTRKQLEEIVGVISSNDDDNNDDSIIVEWLGVVPQLLRLDTTMVVETARVLLEELEIPCELLRQEAPQLLAVPPNHVRYGIEFLSIMMAMPHDLAQIKRTCAQHPILLQSGVEGGMQEKFVQRALGSAADATQSAQQRIAGDTASTLN